MAGAPTPDAERHLVVAASCRDLKRRLGTTAWSVLEDVALDAGVDDDGRLVATTSTRTVAEHLGLTPGTAARALGRLRSLGLVRYTRHDGPAGRFGLAAYVLGAVPGLDVRTGGGDGAQRPRAVSPCADEPRPVSPRADDAPMAPPAVGGRRRVAVSSPATAQLQLLGDHVDGGAAGAPRQDPTLGRSR